MPRPFSKPAARVCVTALLVATTLRAQPAAPAPSDMSPAEIQEYLYRNGARALTVPSPGQPGAEFFSNGARVNTIPTGPYPPAAPPAVPSPSAKPAPVASSVRPSALPTAAASAGSAVSPSTPPVSPALAPPLPEVNQSSNQSLPSDVPIASEPPPRAVQLAPQAVPPEATSPGRTTREEERTPTAGPMRLVDDAESAARPIQFVSGVFGGMARALVIAVVMLSFTVVTIYALSLGIQRRAERARRRASTYTFTKPS